MKSPKSKSIFLANLHYFFAQTDGTYNYPPGPDADLLKQAKKEIENLLEESNKKDIIISKLRNQILSVSFHEHQ